MTETQAISPGYGTGIWKFFASVKLTVVLLILLAATSIVGTLVPQNAAAADYLRVYGVFLFRLMTVLGIFDMFHSWWFQFFILMLTANIVVCSIDRLQSTWKIIFVKRPRFNLTSIRKRRHRHAFSLNRDLDFVRQQMSQLVGRQFRYQRFETMDDGVAIVAEKGRWTRLGVYVVHLSVVTLLAGALIGSMFGFEGFVNIPEGETVNRIRLRNTGGLHQLPFAIRCDDFDMQTYPNGAPKEYRSTLTLLADGKPILTRDIIVNDPLRYNGINLFQASYGKIDGPAPQQAAAQAPPSEFTLNFQSTASQMVYARKAVIGQTLEIPEGLGRFTVTEYKPTAQFGGQSLGPVLIGRLEVGQAAPVLVTLPLQFPHFDKMRRGQVVISIADQPSTQFKPQADSAQRFYTGLQVTYDPGVWVVYVGFIMMITGCWITFFMGHRQVTVELQAVDKLVRVTVSGKTNKNKYGFERTVEQTARRWARSLDQKGA